MPTPANEFECAMGQPGAPVGQAVFVEGEAHHPETNFLVARAGFFRIDELLGSNAYISPADQLAYEQVHVFQYDTASVRWIVLGLRDGYYVYLARQVRPDLDIGHALPYAPCLVPSAEGALVGYHALRFFDDPVNEVGIWYRYDWDRVTGDHFQTSEDGQVWR